MAFRETRILKEKNDLATQDKTMEKLIYVGPQLSVLHKGLGHGGGWHEVQFKCPLHDVKGTVTFADTPGGGVVMTCKIGEPVNGPIDLVDFHNVLSFIVQNYRALSEAMVGAQKNGFLRSDF